MNKYTGIIIGIIALVLITGGIYTSKKNSDNAMMAQQQIDQKVMEDTNIAEENAVMKADTTKTDAMMKKEDTTMMKVGSYESYAPEKVVLASTTHHVVLFFRASWCPTCRVVDADIKANLSKIPESLTILDVDYDNSTALKQKYGVTYQHTFVQVDSNGALIKKWSASPTLAAIVSQVK